MTSCASLLQLTHFKNRNFSFEGKHSLFLLGVALFTVSLPLTSYRKQLQSVCRQFGIFWRTFFGTAAFISLPVSPTNPQQWFWELTLSLNKKVTNFYFLLFCEASYMLQYCKCCFTDCCVHECTTRMRWEKKDVCRQDQVEICLSLEHLLEWLPGCSIWQINSLDIILC